MPLTSGTRLGPYEIIAPLGAGGMGEVYKARDTRLDRIVAVKILPPALAEDPQFRERFDREARAVSALDHPHICALYDVGEAPSPLSSGSHDTLRFLVMQYLEGETLADRIASGHGRGLPLNDALTIAGQIAGALTSAHRVGIVHRDLKPGNVMLTKSGAKLLDFGLAKRSAGRTMFGPPGAASPDLEAPIFAPTGLPTTPANITAEGTILGTVQYMAPEQLEGRDADARVDIWAFGMILYEMVTGRPAFAGASSANLIGAIMNTDPAPVSPAEAGSSRPLQRLIAECLVKDREERWQSIRDVKRQLDAITIGEGSPAPSASRQPPWGRLALAGGSAFVLGAAAVVGFGLVTRAPLPMMRFDIGPPARGSIPHFADTWEYVAASPDGTRVAFVATAAGGPSGIWIKALDQPDAVLVDGSAGARSPFWSPDGRAIAFFSAAQLRKKSLDGGPPQSLCAVQGSVNEGTWGQDGTILFTDLAAHRIMRVSQDGGAPTPVTAAGGPEVGWPSFLPDGRHFLYVSHDAANNIVNAFVGSLDSAKPTPIPGVNSRAEFAAGRLLFWREGTLLAQPFDTGRFALTGSAIPIADLVTGFASTGSSPFSAAGSRLLVYQAGAVANRLVWVDREGRDLETIGQPRDYASLRLAPDASSVAVTVRDPHLGTNDLWIHDFRRDVDRRLTTEKGTENGPIWSPDGQTIVYAADRRGPPHLHARDAGGSDERQITAPSLGIQVPTAFTPDGRFVVYTDVAAGTGADVAMVPIDGSSAPVPLVRTKAADFAGRPSPDGRWLAYVSTESGRAEVYVRAFRDDRPRWQISRAGGANPKWRGDGREIFYVEGGTRIMSIDVTGTAFDLNTPRVLFTRTAFADYDVSADGKRFFFSVLDAEAEKGALRAISNWPSLLSKK